MDPQKESLGNTALNHLFANRTNVIVSIAPVFEPDFFFEFLQTADVVEALE